MSLNSVMQIDYKLLHAVNTGLKCRSDKVDEMVLIFTTCKIINIKILFHKLIPTYYRW